MSEYNTYKSLTLDEFTGQTTRGRDLEPSPWAQASQQAREQAAQAGPAPPPPADFDPAYDLDPSAQPPPEGDPDEGRLNSGHLAQGEFFASMNTEAVTFASKTIALAKDETPYRFTPDQTRHLAKAWAEYAAIHSIEVSPLAKIGYYNMIYSIPKILAGYQDRAGNQALRETAALRAEQKEMFEQINRMKREAAQAAKQKPAANEPATGNG